MLIIDTREKQDAIANILTEFDRRKIPYTRKKLDVGDYQNTENPLIAIERKQNLQELCGNLCQNKARFYREFDRAKAKNIKLILLVEHGEGIKQLEDVAKWKNPRLKTAPRAISGRELMERLHKLKVSYGIDILFCNKSETGRIILEQTGADASRIYTLKQASLP